VVAGRTWVSKANEEAARFASTRPRRAAELDVEVCPRAPVAPNPSLAMPQFDIVVLTKSEPGDQAE